ncbi:hypothetical protein [Rickettsia felis]|nr:hypothetical protein [Rickettsia felis]
MCHKFFLFSFNIVFPSLREELQSNKGGAISGLWYEIATSLRSSQ